MSKPSSAPGHSEAVLLLHGYWPEPYLVENLLGYFFTGADWLETRIVWVELCEFDELAAEVETGRMFLRLCLVGRICGVLDYVS
ncbi:hypothetical protein C3B44_05070 [Corynebacterium yudongzhengii]|uniref:Uncharacterized protein n=1 Tax=Corynebacterium yudongzhengii TaxID=2080740 RepID=A0A2U1T3Z4_9CORY|nr:hypothetical protein C3B44_05070 [Corynebacterium yudongzhengii]PWC00702.1 hypothetical protein DF222_11450 [Corynebacterium yudongzhengii]